MSPKSYIALSATTANTIKGTEPYLLYSDTRLTSLDPLLEISMPKSINSAEIQVIDKTMANKPISAFLGMKFKQINALVNADGQLYPITDSRVVVSDVDGDAVFTENTSVGGKMKATWTDKNGTQVVNLDQTMDPTYSPYTLKVEIPEVVTANTKYGDPNTYEYGIDQGITYTFTV